MTTLFKGPCATYSGMGKLFHGLASRLMDRLAMELLPLDNVIAPGWDLPMTEFTRANQFGVIIGKPPQLNQLPAKYRVLYTMYEGSDIPEQWKLDVKRASEVWVPSTFCQEVFAPYCGEARIVGAGYDERWYHSRTEVDRDRFWAMRGLGEISQHRIIGTAGVMSPRKGVDLLIEACQKAALRDTVLVIKTRDTRQIPDVMDDWVVVIDDDWPELVMAEFYRSIDLFAWPTRGEGIGLPPLESAACGTPALVTRASGPCEYIDDRGIYGIEVAKRVPAVNVAAEHCLWYEPSLDDLVDKLRAFVYDPPEVQHRYRQHSLGFLADKWEAEILAARRRASTWAATSRNS